MLHARSARPALVHNSAKVLHQHQITTGFVCLGIQYHPPVGRDCNISAHLPWGSKELRDFAATKLQKAQVTSAVFVRGREIVDTLSPCSPAATRVHGVQHLRFLAALNWHSPNAQSEWLPPAEVEKFSVSRFLGNVRSLFGMRDSRLFSSLGRDLPGGSWAMAG
jgi:hypothetical protein